MIYSTQALLLHQMIACNHIMLHQLKICKMQIYHQLLYLHKYIFYQNAIIMKLIADKINETYILFLCFILINSFAFINTIPIDKNINELNMMFFLQIECTHKRFHLKMFCYRLSRCCY